VSFSLALLVAALLQQVPRSQHGSITQRVGITDIAISYNRPVARGRELFGADGIIRWGRVWHPGADSATTPQPWTVIFSRAVGVWHTPYPGESSDVLRVTVTSEQGAHMEALAYYFPVVTPDSALLRLHWGTTIVPIWIKPKA